MLGTLHSCKDCDMLILDGNVQMGLAEVVGEVIRGGVLDGMQSGFGAVKKSFHRFLVMGRLM